MSTLAYAAFTTSREESPPTRSMLESPPGVGTYIDALAALVPAEVLTLHAVILSVTTATAGNATSIPRANLPTLSVAFFGMLALSTLLYVVARLLKKKWDMLDYVRMLIPPLAFTAWTMLQKTTAFDAVWPRLEAVPRTVAALFLAVVLGLIASALAYQADRKAP